jgi:hypothetical protein
VEQARRIGEVQVDLNRVRACRRNLMAFEFDACNSQPFEDTNLQSSYPTETRSVAHALCRDPMFEGAQTIAAPKPLEWDDRLATILEDKTRDLAALDRYERRALRCKFVIRDFDPARAVTAPRRSGKLAPCVEA